MRRRAFEILEERPFDDWVGRLINGFVLLLILGNVAAVVLESVASFEQAFHRELVVFEVFSVAVFSLEYVIRIWCCVEEQDGRYRRRFTGRLRFAGTPMALIDALAILPFYLAALFALDLRVLRVFRLMRVFRLTKYSAAADMLVGAVRAEGRALASALGVLLVLLVFSSTLVYYTEHVAQPEKFSSIPAAMWWGMATLTTVGYGDMAPVTPLGQLLGGLIAILGVGMFALPAGILASGFAEQMKRRDFLAMWHLVAGVNMFKGLDADQIAHIVDLLQYQRAVPGERIFALGDPSHAAYFVLSGELEARVRDQRFPIETGSIVGEIGLLRSEPRSASVFCTKTAELLMLGAGDFDRLTQLTTDLHSTMEQVALKRLAQLSPAPPEGD